MDYLDIEGGRPLQGEARIQGSKNAALPILSAALLHPGPDSAQKLPGYHGRGGHVGALEGLWLSGAQRARDC